MEILEKIDLKYIGLNEKRYKHHQNLRKDFASILKPLFKIHPQVENISWHPFIPLFDNVNNYVFSDIDNIFINGKQLNKSNLSLLNSFNDFKEALNLMPDSFYKEVFKYSMKVQINNNGTIYVEDMELE